MRRPRAGSKGFLDETSKKPPKGEGKPGPFKNVGEAGWEKGFVFRVMGRVQRVLEPGGADLRV